MDSMGDGAGVTDSVAGGLAEEEEVRDLFFLRSTSGSEVKFSGREKLVIHYHIFDHRRRKHKS
jgi:hypothetical protein